MLLMWWLAGCGGDPECTAETCAEQVPEVSAATAFERSLVVPLLQEIRGGVGPWDDEGIGVCRGARSCEAFLGAEPGELPPGEYLVRADLKVPSVGAPGTWTVRFETVCQPEGAEAITYNRTYDVVSPGGDRPFRLGVLRRMTSPSPEGAERCSYTLVAPHPDGDKVYSGSWSVSGA